MVDVTEQKRSEQRLRQLVEELPVVTYLSDGLERERAITPSPTWPRGSWS